MKKNLNPLITAVLFFSSITFFNNIQTEVSPTNDYFETNIEQFHKRVDDLATIETAYLGQTKTIDLTVLTGISSIEMFKKFYSHFELPDLWTNLGLFSSTRATRSFSAATDYWLENWSTKSTLIEGSEEIGSAYIYGILSLTINIEKNVELNHLLVIIKFYGTGDFESTGTHPWGEIDTGWVLRLIPR